MITTLQCAKISFPLTCLGLMCCPWDIFEKLRGRKSSRFLNRLWVVASSYQCDNLQWVLRDQKEWTLIFPALLVTLVTSHAGQVGNQNPSHQAAVLCDARVLAISSAAWTLGVRISSSAGMHKKQAQGIFQPRRLRLGSLGVIPGPTNCSFYDVRQVIYFCGPPFHYW